jgi:hypothetical protein
MLLVHLKYISISLSPWLSEKALQSLLESLTCPPYTPTQHLEREQALAKEFAEILHFTLRFDELKVRTLTSCESSPGYHCFMAVLPRLWSGFGRVRCKTFPRRLIMW